MQKGVCHSKGTDDDDQQFRKSVIFQALVNRLLCKIAHLKA